MSPRTRSILSFNISPRTLGRRTHQRRPLPRRGNNFSPGNTNLPIGGTQSANREIGVPRVIAGAACACVGAVRKLHLLSLRQSLHVEGSFPSSGWRTRMAYDGDIV